ncbi:MAG: hypothetical protein QOC63_4036, partial [Mycobacterium sp.]|nr:hypothetical protein [Mycobacterium sp.]
KSGQFRGADTGSSANSGPDTPWTAAKPTDSAVARVEHHLDRALVAVVEVCVECDQREGIWDASPNLRINSGNVTHRSAKAPRATAPATAAAVRP